MTSSLLINILLVYLVVCGIAYLAQRQLLYRPTTDLPDVASDNYLMLSGHGAQLRITIANRQAHQALIYFGGNNEAAARNLPLLQQVFPLHAIYIMHYRGYDGSSGRPAEDALIDDGQRLYDLVAERHRDITLIGRSLGSGIAVVTAARNRVERLVLVTPYDSMVNVASRQYPWLPVSWLLLDRYEATLHAPTVQAPTLIIAASDDKLTPATMAESLYKSFAEGVAKMITINAGHNDIQRNSEYPYLLKGDFGAASPESLKSLHW